MSSQTNGTKGALRRAAAPLAAAAVSMALLAGCAGSSTTSSPPPTTGGGSTKTTGTNTSTGGTTVGTTPDAACVKDIAKVIATKPTPESTTAQLPADLVSKLDAAAEASFKQAAAPGAIVGVRTPQGTWIAAYGEADPVAHTPMTTDMHTRIGSVTKTFTGTLIMQLAEDGKLSLDDTIDKYVDGIPNGNRITLRMLADMTSGLASYTRSTKFTDVFFAKPETVWTPDELIAIGVGESPIFEPGEKFDYSNTNTVLLGKVVEKVTGKPLADAYPTQILDPLKMANTSWPGTSTEMPAPYAQGYTLQGNAATPENPSNATNWNPSWGDAAGELISNMNDLLVYDRALGTGQGLLDPASQAERLSFPDGPDYGIAIGCIDGWVGHTGELPGYNTSLYYDTTSDTSVVVQVNSDIASGDCPRSPTLTDDPRTEICSAPATRMFVGISGALGHQFTPLPAK